LNKARGYLKEVKFIAATIVPMLARARKSAPAATQGADKEFTIQAGFNFENYGD
jgi:hypothetical protein